VGAILIVLMLRHTRAVTGPSFWGWTFHDVPAWPLYPLMIIAALPLLVGQMTYRPLGRMRTIFAILLAMLSCFAMKLVAVAVFTQPLSLHMIPTIVQNPQAVSYYTDAAALNSRAPVRQWIEEYPSLMWDLSLHSKTKAPGPILYFTAFIKWVGVGERTALVSGLALGVIATLSIPATFLLVRRLTRSSEAAICGAAFLSLCPGFVLFFPMFDPMYILLSTGLIGLWSITIEQRSIWAAVALGALLALTCTITFNVLVIGLFMTAYPFILPGDDLASRLRTAISRGFVAMLTAVILLMVLRQTTGYDAYATFISAWKNQHRLLEQYREQRLYPQTIPWDLADFALGSGWMSFVLVMWFFASRGNVDRRVLRIAVLCIAQLVAVAVTGLLQLETARVWNFMLPLLMVPVGLELRTWPLPARIAVLFTLCVVTAAVAHNVKFIY
jgi:hypothetical protein